MEYQRQIDLPRRLIVCGDSFNIGIGCQDLTTQPYGSLLAKHLGIPLINLAKGSSTNLSIWLQVEYAVKKLNAGADDLVLVNETSSERINWFPDDYDSDREITNLDVNYHEYPPYGANSYHQILSQHPMHNDPDYRGEMFTENMRGVVDYLDNFVSKGFDQRGQYYNRLTGESVQKLKLIKDFYATVYNEKLSQIQSRSMMSMSATLLKNKGVKHLMLIPNTEPYKDLVAAENIMELSWGQLTLQYPDTIPTGHANEYGHERAFSLILAKLKMNGWA